MLKIHAEQPQQQNIIIKLLPGPDRKRIPSPYWYQVTYISPQPERTGCMMTWRVLGGRTVYQIALEKEETGRLRFHCTCADAVFRAETQGRLCKHIRGLLGMDENEGDENQPTRRGA